LLQRGQISDHDIVAAQAAIIPQAGRSGIASKRAFRNKPAKNLARHVSQNCRWLIIHPVDWATGLHVMFVCCVEAPQRTVIALLETCQITATTRG
jgi:hypothetical protein